MSSQPIPYPIRMPEELRDSLAERARLGGRSLHAEIIGILQEAVQGRTEPQSTHDVDVLAEVIADKVAAKLRCEHTWRAEDSE